MAFVNVQGFNLEYAWYGPRPAEATTLVFLHGGLGSLAAWGDYPERVAEKTGCSALVYSRKGYGKSDAAPLPRAISFMHEEALDSLPYVLSAFDLRNPVLIGHSDGASIAIIHCGSFPGTQIRALILEAPHVFVEKETIDSIQQTLREYESGDVRSKLAKYQDHVDHTFNSWVRVWLDPAFRNWNIEEFLPRIQIPSLVIQGEKDEFGTIAQVESIRKNSGGPVTTKVLPDCGHRPHRRYPEESMQAIMDFLCP